MKNIWTITAITIKEALAKKIIITFFIISSFVLLMFTIIFVSADVESFGNIVQRQDGKEVLNILAEAAKILKVALITPLFWGGIFLSIFSASSFIPNMLEKGNVDVLLSKPIARYQLLFGKFLGGLIVVTLNVAYAVIGIWLLIGFKFNVWDVSLFYTIVTISFAFSVLYSMMILIGILTQSSILGMILSYLILFILSPVLAARDQIAILIENEFVITLMDVIYYIIPKTAELTAITASLAMGESALADAASIGESITYYQPILSSLAFLILMLGTSIIIFNKKDY